MFWLAVLLYNTGIRLYGLAIQILSLYNSKADKWYSGRKDLLIKIENDLAPFSETDKRIWMHCASLGEFEQGRPLIESLRKQHPKALIILTFFSPSGYEVRKNYTNADKVYYLPLDTPGNAKKFLKLMRPELVIFVKYEFWFHFFKEIRRSGSRFILISSVFRNSQPFFKWYGILHRYMLNCLTHIFVQDDLSLKLLSGIGITHVSKTNDTRIDRVASIADHARILPTLEMFLSGSKALVAGSIYEAENEMLVQAFKERLFDGKWIIVPHNIDPEHIRKISEPWGEQVVIYTEFSENGSAGKNVMIVDTIGLLSNMYKYASISVIGGGFGKGIHNTLEPAAFGIPVLFGPEYHKFNEAEALIESGGGFSFSDYDMLKTILNKLQDPEIRNKSGKASGDFIRTNTGGTDSILSWITGNKQS